MAVFQYTLLTKRGGQPHLACQAELTESCFKTLANISPYSYDKSKIQFLLLKYEVIIVKVFF